MTVSRRWTSADLELFPDDERVRYEIIDGELFVSKTPHAAHQYTCACFTFDLEQWNRRSGLGVALVAPGLVFADDADVIPDVVWVSKDRLSKILDSAGHLRSAPEIVIEVLSPGAGNERRDRELKLSLYSRQGVEEYWIADRRLGIVQVYRREQAALRLVQTLKDGDLLTSPLLPGFSCQVSTLWGSFGEQPDSDC
jgi:Uma2 family endonuclease